MKNRDFLITQLKNCPRSQTKDGMTYLWYDQPCNLYYESEQATAYLDMIEKENFAKSLHDPAVQLVTEYSAEIISDTLENVEFYDLGPGLPTKTLPLLKACLNRNCSLTYIPVDISVSFLALAEREVKKCGISSHGMNCLFEELPSLLSPKAANTTRIFQIGLTFNNYRPNTILGLLSQLSEDNDISLIITEYYRTQKKQSLLLPYQDIYAERFNFLSLKMLGLEKNDFRYHAEYRNQRIEMGFIPIKPLNIEGLQLSSNNKIVTAISYRYKKHHLTRHIMNYFHRFEMFKRGDLVIFKLKE